MTDDVLELFVIEVPRLLPPLMPVMVVTTMVGSAGAELLTLGGGIRTAIGRHEAEVRCCRSRR